MPTDLDDADTSGIELYFADDLEGQTFYLRESAVYDAEEVREETESDTPQFGRWLPVASDGETDGWAVAVGELVEELQDTTEDPTAMPWTVTRCQKSGPEQTDPYEVNIAVEDGVEASQQGLAEASSDD